MNPPQPLSGQPAQPPGHFRLFNLLLVVASMAGMGFALYLQKYQYLDPCPMCIFQRYGLIIMGVVALIAMLVYPKTRRGQRLALLLAFIPIAWSAGVAARHVWIQHFPPADLDSCGGASLDMLMQLFPFQEVMKKVLYGSGDCAVVDWSLLGFSLPHRALFFFLGLCGLILWRWLHTR